MLFHRPTGIGGANTAHLDSRSRLFASDRWPAKPLTSRRCHLKCAWPYCSDCDSWPQPVDDGSFALSRLSKRLEKADVERVQHVLHLTLQLNRPCLVIPLHFRRDLLQRRLL